MTALIGDVELPDLPEDYVWIRRAAGGDYSAIAFEPGQHRVITSEFDRVADRDEHVTFEQLRQSLVRVAGTDFGMHNPRWISRFNDAARRERHRPSHTPRRGVENPLDRPSLRAQHRPDGPAVPLSRLRPRTARGDRSGARGTHRLRTELHPGHHAGPLPWLARSRRNAQLLSPRSSVPTPGWTIGAWFIPLVNLVAPRRLVLDIGRASSTSWEETRDTTLVNLWWAAWIGHGLVLVTANRVAPGSMALLVAAEALMIAAAVLLGLVIERITVLQSAALGATVLIEPLARP
jgi:hypothetical protein